MSPPRLTPAQKAVVDFTGNAAVIAAAGSGKTFTLVEKIASLVESGVTLDRFFISTFTKKAGEEIRKRLEKRLGLASAQSRALNADTLHGLAANLLKENTDLLKLPRDFQILEGALSKIDLLKLIRTRLLEWAEGGDSQTIHLIERYDFHKAVKLLWEILLSTPRIPPFEYEPLARRLFDEFTLKKRAQAFLDFQDLELEALRLLENDKARASIQKRYSWIIIDEFQDTSPLQWDIISRIWGPENRLVIVGDPRQSIYRFRGADPHLFSKVSRLIQESGKGQVFYLNENFRSRAEIIRVVNKVSARLFNQEGDPENEMMPPLVAAAELLEETLEQTMDCVECHLLESGKIAETRASESTWLSEKIQALHHGGIAWNRIALLFRTRRAIPLFADALKARNIPYQTQDEKTLLERPEALRISFLLKKLLHPQDAFYEEAFRYTLIDPLLWEEIRRDFERKTDLQTFLDSFFSKLGAHVPEASKPYLDALQVLADNLVLLGARSLEELVSHWEILREEEAIIPSPPPTPHEDSVSLMTIHASKGLEFDAVFLCDLMGRRTSFQRLYAKDQNGHIHLRDFDAEESVGLKHRLAKSLAFEACEKRENEEEDRESRRLLYVALTRAIRYLGMALIPPKSSKKGTYKDWKDYLHEALGD